MKIIFNINELYFLKPEIYSEILWWRFCYARYIKFRLNIDSMFLALITILLISVKHATARGWNYVPSVSVWYVIHKLQWRLAFTELWSRRYDQYIWYSQRSQVNKMVFAKGKIHHQTKEITDVKIIYQIILRTLKLIRDQN